MKTDAFGKKVREKALRLVLCMTVTLMGTGVIVSHELSAAPKPPPVPEQAETCLGCHDTKDTILTFKNKETMSVFVDRNAFKKTAHSGLQCTDCHTTVSLDAHPGRVIENRKTFTKEAADACRNCHTSEQLGKTATHNAVTTKPDAPLCSVCHGSHGVRRIAEWKLSLKGKDYCLTCHRQALSTTFGSGEKLSLRIDPSNLASSVHNKHVCSDCHTEYTPASHPVKTYANSRDHSVSVAGVCKRCHAEKAAQIKGSTHYNLSFQVGETLIRQGNQQAPVCTDCHGFHTVGPKSTYEILSGVPCRKCHEGIFKIYAKSVHGLAKERGEHRAPLCASCHFAHEVSFTATTDKIKVACLGCHKGIEGIHNKWLPNAELHLSAVACAACHVPSSEKGISLQLIDQASGKPFPREQILQLLGNTDEELAERLDAHGQGLNSYELAYIVRQLNEKGSGAKVTFLGRMDIMKYSDAHQLSLKKNAIRECENCHSKDSRFFKRVTLAVIRTDGRMDRYRTQPDVLSSVFSTLSSKQFYVLGGTRFTLLDWAGLLVVFGGILVPLAHITVRVLTAPLRRQPKPGDPKKGGKI